MTLAARGWWMVWGVALSTTACAPTHYVRIAEAFTAPTLSESIRLERRFTDSERVQACRSPVRIARLDVVPSSLQMVSGARYELSSLTIVAVDEAGELVPRVPVIVEAEETVPSRVQLPSDDRDLAEGRLLALAPGEFHVRIRTMCPVGPTAERTVTGRVTK
jgi:hypothetical protein